MSLSMTDDLMNEEQELMSPNYGNMGDDSAVQREQSEPCYGNCLNCCGSFLACFCLTACCGGCCGGCNPYKQILRGKKGVITRFGSIKRIVSDGLHYVNLLTENLDIVDLRLMVHKLKPQNIITKDNLAVTIDGCVYYKIKDTDNDIIMAKYGVANVNLAVDELAHSTLRFVLGQHTLQECLEKRREFAKEMRQILGSQALNWGIIIEDIQIIDIVLSKHIQDLLSSASTATREAEAQLIMARASVDSAHMQREAADLLNTPAAMQMRMLDAYKVLAESQNAKIIFMPGIGGGNLGIDGKTSHLEQMNNLTANIVGNNVSK